MAVDIGGMRKPYHDKSDFFDFKDLVAREPFEQFKAWFDEASKNEKIYEANAMCLSTATPDGIPSSRWVKLFCSIICPHPHTYVIITRQDGVTQKVWARGIHLLHQLHQQEGGGAGHQPQGRAGLLLGASAAVSVGLIGS